MPSQHPVGKPWIEAWRAPRRYMSLSENQDEIPRSKLLAGSTLAGDTIQHTGQDYAPALSPLLEEESSRVIPGWSSLVAGNSITTKDPSYVETEIQCPTPSTCAARRIRRSRLDHYPAAWTLLDNSWRSPTLSLRGILMPFADGKLYYPRFFDRYFADPDLINSSHANVSQTTEDKYTIRLAQMLNTYFSCLNAFFAITSGISNDTAYFWDNNQTFKLPLNVNGSWGPFTNQHQANG